MQPNTTQFQADEVICRYEKDLVSEGLITSDQLAIANISKENLGLSLGSVLIKKGFVSEEALLQFVSKRLKIPFITLKDYQLDPEVLHRIPLHLAKQHQVVPLSIKENKVLVGMANPFNSFAKEDIRDFFKCDEIETYLVSATEIQETLSRFADEPSVSDDSKIVTVEISSDSGADDESETRKMQEMALGPKIVAAVNNIIARANSERASDVHIEPTRENVTIRFRIDGMLRERGTFNKSMQLALISRIKILAGLDIAERRIPQDGRVRILLIGKPLDMRVSTCPTQHGEKIVIRILSKEGVTSIESLGFGDHERKVFSDIITKSHGIFLSTGPTGSGKSTTLYAALSRLNSPEVNIISIEDPIENEIIGVNQVAVNNKQGLTFATVLRSVLRQDPDIVMLGEIRDAETAQIAVRAAITGHMVLSTLHTNTAAGAISRLQDLGVEPFMIASALKGVMAQRLVRRICKECVEEIEPVTFHSGTEEYKTKKNFRGKGCKQCGYTGYSGRAGIFELAAINEEVRTLITKNAKESEIVEALRRNEVKSIVQDGIDKVAQKITTVEEVLRVTGED